MRFLPQLLVMYMGTTVSFICNLTFGFYAVQIGFGLKHCLDMAALKRQVRSQFCNFGSGDRVPRNELCGAPYDALLCGAIRKDTSVY